MWCLEQLCVISLVCLDLANLTNELSTGTCTVTRDVLKSTAHSLTVPPIISPVQVLGLFPLWPNIALLHVLLSFTRLLQFTQFLFNRFLRGAHSTLKPNGFACDPRGKNLGGLQQCCVINTSVLMNTMVLFIKKNNAWADYLRRTIGCRTC